MREVFLKIDDLKDKFLKLQEAYKNNQIENITLKKRVINLKKNIEKQNSNKLEEIETEGIRAKVDNCIREIDEVIKILS